MDKIKHNIKLDLADGGSQDAVYVRQNDTAAHVLIFHLRTNGKTYRIADDVVARIYSVREDGSKLYNACTIEDNTIRTEITTDTIAVAGRVECVLELIGTEPAVLTTPGFDIIVEHVDGMEGIEGTNEFSALVQQTAETKALQMEIEQKLENGEFNGEDGVTPEFTIGTVTTLEAGQNATASIGGTAEKPVLNLGIPKGRDGKDGEDAEGGSGGTTDHAELTNRDAANQHPMGAISGLEDALADKQPAGNYALKSDIPKTAEEVNALPNTTKIPAALADLDDDANHRVVTDKQIEEWNSKSDFSGDYGDLKNIPEAPVTSVNGMTGTVKLDAAAVGAHADTWMPTPEQVSADPAGTATAAVGRHNTDNDAHEDIRLLVQNLTARLNALANSEDVDLDQMAELVAYIKDNRELIEQITTAKVSYTDIINNLTTNVSNKPLSAAQGVELKRLIDAIKVITKLSEMQDDSAHRTVTDEQIETWNGKSDFSGNYNDLENQPTIPAVPTRLSAFENDMGYLVASDVDFDPTVYGLPVLYLTGDISPIAVSKDNKVTLTYTYGERTGTCTLKGQGATSYKTAQALVNAGKAGKFNYTINFDNAFEAATGWGSQKKYCLKANFIDHSHSRNVVSAKLWGLIVKSRTTANTNLSSLPNGGAVDGFPIVIMLNNEFHGLYTFNIPKDGWMMGMVEDTTKQQALLGANDHLPATQFKGESAGNDSDFELEFVSDEDNADWVTPSLNRLINACINSWGGDLDTTVAQYLDWDSAIDYYIFIVVLKGTDMVDKNYLLSTFDGTKWHFTAYDMDSTYGLEWDGSGLTRAVSNVSFEECAATHRVYELIKRFKTNALKARYNALRQNVLSETRICQYFENFAWAIPSPIALEDVKKYPTILGSGVNGIDQICRWVRQRLEATDAWLAALPAQETPVEPEEPVEVINQVPISTDTDGSIFNGVGYKDDARLSSSGGLSSSAQVGSTTTGFIPFRSGDIIRLKNVEFIGNWDKYPNQHYYIAFYNSSKAFVGYFGESTFIDGTGSATDYEYDAANNITTLILKSGVDSQYGQYIDTASYIRITVHGKGADFILTINQEIT